MKNVIRLWSVTIVGLLLCSFSGSPEILMNTNVERSATENLSFGGAYLVFAGKFGGQVTKKQVAGQCELGVDGCAKGSRIFTFTLEITRAGKTTSYAARSNTLTTEMLTALKSLKAGDSFNFKKIKAYLPNGKEEVEVHSREFVVV